MENLDTYNRVPTLESKHKRNILQSIYILLLLVAIAGFATWWVLPEPWQYTAHSAGLALTMYVVLVLYDRRKTKPCKFCGNSLNYVVRPLLLTDKYLTMEGQKMDDYFYTRCYWGNQPFRKRWAKISNRSKICHHCRLMEENSRQYYEPVSPEEQEQLSSPEAFS